MFSVHERIQRRVCRIAFMAFCAVPTLATFVWVLYFHRPWQERDWQRTFEQTLHVRAELSRVAAPRPLERELTDLRLTDLSTAAALLKIKQLHIGPGQVLSTDELQFDSRQIGNLASAVNIWLAGDEFSVATLQAGRVLISNGAHNSWQLSDVVVQTQIMSTGERRIALQGMFGEVEKPVRLVIDRHSDGSWQVALDTQQTKLPTWLLANLVPGAGRWQGAAFNGVLQWQSQEAADAIGSFRGQVAPLDIQQWIGRHSSLKLTAQAKLQFEQLNWRGHRIELAQGTLETSPGTVSSSMLNELKEGLYCVIKDEAVLASQEPITFDQIACHFRLDAAGLSASGICTTEKGCLVAAKDKSLVMQPGYSSLPLSRFVRLFCPLQGEWLPATAEAVKLADQLPLSKNNQVKK